MSFTFQHITLYRASKESSVPRIMSMRKRVKRSSGIIIYEKTVGKHFKYHFAVKAEEIKKLFSVVSFINKKSLLSVPNRAEIIRS